MRSSNRCTNPANGPSCTMPKWGSGRAVIGSMLAPAGRRSKNSSIIFAACPLPSSSKPASTPSSPRSPRRAVMLEDIRRAQQAGAQGVVTGVLRADGEIDADRTGELIAAARPLHVTFHRAFDVCRDASRALETLVALGVERVLSSGQAATAPEGADTIARLVRQAAGRIGVLPGGGVTPDNAAALVRATGVTEVHLTGAVPHQSAMTFRAPAVTLGNAAPRSEYEWSVTDAEQIQRVVRGL